MKTMADKLILFFLDINCYGPIYSEPPPIMSAISCDEQNNVPVPLPRSFEMVPYVETQQPQPVQQQQEEVVESVAASRRLVVLCLFNYQTQCLYRFLNSQKRGSF